MEDKVANLKAIILALFLLGTSPYSCSQAREVSELETVLRSADCMLASNSSGLRMRILGREFRLPDDFVFRGLDRGHARFVRVRSDKPEDHAFVYFSSGSERRYNREKSPDFVEVNWNDTTIFYRSSEGGRAVPIKLHQAIIQKNEDELAITATSLHLIGSIIACSKIISHP